MIAAAGSEMGLMRLHRLSELRRYKLCAIDGEIGSVEEAHFDDRAWTVRYLVAGAGTWRAVRSVLISTIAIGDIDDAAKAIHVQLPHSQIMDGPRLEEERPLSRRTEVEYFRYHGWPPYWDSAPSSMPYLPFQTSPMETESSEETHLRSTTEVNGYQIEAEDGQIGHITDFLIDEKTWQLCYLVIDTRLWLPGKHVLLNPGWIKEIDWTHDRLVADLRKEIIASAPAYDPASPIDRDYEIKLFEHYARKKYWE